MEESAIKIIPRYPKKKVETCSSTHPTTGRQCGLPITHMGLCSNGMGHPTWEKNLPKPPEVDEPVKQEVAKADSTNSMLYGDTSECVEHCEAISKLLAALRQYGKHTFHECLYEQLPDKSMRHRGQIITCRCNLANVIAQYENIYG